MKYALVLINVLFMLSCSRYTQIYETASSLPKNNNQYVFENDTLKITYNFWGNRGLFFYQIYNNLSQPIYIDWAQSSFVVNNNKFNYWIDQATTHSSGIAFNYSRLNYVTASRSTTVRPEQITFIAPHSFVSRSDFYIYNAAVPISSCTEKIVHPEDQPSKNIKAKCKSFTERNTPLVFRNFLTISVNNGFDHPFYIDNAFYIKGVMTVKRAEAVVLEGYSDSQPKYKFHFYDPSSFYVNIK